MFKIFFAVSSLSIIACSSPGHRISKGNTLGSLSPAPISPAVAKSRPVSSWARSPSAGTAISDLDTIDECSVFSTAVPLAASASLWIAALGARPIFPPATSFAPSLSSSPKRSTVAGCYRASVYPTNSIRPTHYVSSSSDFPRSSPSSVVCGSTENSASLSPLLWFLSYSETELKTFGSDFCSSSSLIRAPPLLPKHQRMDSKFEEEEEHRNPFVNDSVDGSKLLCSRLVPKLQFRSEISVAHWCEDMKMGEITQMKGSGWTSIGISRNGGKLYCTIEEILFLVERGAMRLMNGEYEDLNLRNIYGMITEGKSGCSWEHFVAYRHLKSLGYIVRRHGLPWTLKGQNACYFHPSQPSNDQLCESDKDIERVLHVTELFRDMNVDELKLDFDVFLPSSKFKKASPGNPTFILSLASEKPPLRMEIENLEKRCNGVPLKFCNVDHERVRFFSFDKFELPFLP